MSGDPIPRGSLGCFNKIELPRMESHQRLGTGLGSLCSFNAGPGVRSGTSGNGWRSRRHADGGR